MIRALTLLALAIATPAAAFAQAPTRIAADAPELARRGSHGVGTAETTVTLADRPDVFKTDPAGGFARASRTLTVVLWYPAASGTPASRASYQMPTPDIAGGDPSAPAMVEFTGDAVRGAAPAAGRFPLVVLSHGYGNRAVMFSELGENLASKGYVVAAIEHEDATNGGRVPRELSALSAIVHRSADQRGVIAELVRRSRRDRDGILAHADADRLALGGYSMGGFGALASAGAGYDKTSPVLARVPAGLVDPLIEGSNVAIPGVKALLLLAPWGGGPQVRMWTPAALSAVRAPTLIVAGDKDDVSDFPTGVRWIHDSLGSTDRYLLVYREARHNVAMNASPAALRYDHRYFDRYDEPVWRKDRILAVNAHFVTAFLDLKLKGMTDRAGYLDVPTPVADDGQWPLAPGAVAGAAFAGGDEASKGYWRGFHRRWALGLELHRRSAQ